MKTLLLLFVAISFASCIPNAVNTNADILRKHPNLSYDQALMRFGTPTETIQGDDVFIVSWDNRYEVEKMGALPKENGPGVKYYKYKAIAGAKIIITFDKATKKMTYWKICTKC